jgi:hypothetical protein
MGWSEVSWDHNIAMADAKSSQSIVTLPDTINSTTQYNVMPPPNLIPEQRCQVSSAPEACAENSNLLKISVYRYLTAVTRSRFEVLSCEEQG